MVMTIVENVIFVSMRFGVVRHSRSYTPVTGSECRAGWHLVDHDKVYARVVKNYSTSNNISKSLTVVVTVYLAEYLQKSNKHTTLHQCNCHSSCKCLSANMCKCTYSHASNKSSFVIDHS